MKNILAAALLAIVLILTARAAAPPSPVAVPSNFFGISVFSASSYPLGGGIVVGTEGKVGGITITGIEPTCDGGTSPSNACYKWATMDAWVSRAQTNGWTLVYDWDNLPYWMCGNAVGVRCTVLPTSLSYISNVATAMATRYKGQIKYYETENEINYSTNWSDTCANLVLLHNTIRTAIKAVDSSALVGAPNMGIASSLSTGSCSNSPTRGGGAREWIFMQNFLQTRDSGGHLPTVDSVGEHFYSRNNAIPLNSVTSAVASPSSNLYVYNNFRSVMTAAGIPTSAPLLSTEASFGRASGITLSASDQVAFIGRFLVTFASTWSDGGGILPSWYAYDINFGTLNGSNGMNPLNAAAYGQMESWLTGATFSSQCAPGAPSTVIVCPYTTASGQNAEIIFNNNAGANAVFTVPSWATFAQSLQGRSMAISGGVVTVNNTPILLIEGGSFSTNPNSLAFGAVLDLTTSAGQTVATIVNPLANFLSSRPQWPARHWR